MTIYELRCAWWNYESDEDDYYGNSIIGLYATKELAENATKNLDVLKISRSEFSKFVKEYDREGLDKINLGVYYENPYKKNNMCMYYNTCKQWGR